MNRKLSRQREDEQRLIERAAEWFNVLEDAGADERAEFVDWISRSPRHLEEFLLTSAVAREVGRVDLQTLAPIQDTLARVVQLPRVPAEPKNEALKSRDGRFTRRWKWGAAIAATALIATTVAMLWSPGIWRSYATAVGEQRTVQLADGTIMHLNMRTRANVRYSRDERSIRLLEGEALFDVARDAKRPFRVITGVSVIQAVGTQFNVLRRPLGTTVSVIEGIVQVQRSSQRPARLAAGEEARIGLDGRIENRQHVDMIAVAPWRQHRLEFRTDALVDIAAEFNRYNVTPRLTVIGDAIKRRHYSGVFDANDPGSLIEFLRQDPQLLLEQQGNNLVIRPR